MGMIPQRMLKETVTSRDYTPKCECDKPAAFVGLFKVRIADSVNLIPEALFLCNDCAADADAGVELHSLSNKDIRDEIETFARTKAVRVKEPTCASEEERRRRKSESDRRYYQRLKERNSDEWMERRRQYNAAYRARRKAEQQQGASHD